MQDAMPAQITINGTMSGVTAWLNQWKNPVTATTMAIIPAVNAPARRCSFIRVFLEKCREKTTLCNYYSRQTIIGQDIKKTLQLVGLISQLGLCVIP